MSQSWVATVKNKPRKNDRPLGHPAFRRTVILKEAPALGRIIQTDKGGRPSN